jgi:hypothetical protein
LELLETLVNTTLSLVICKSDYGAANEVVEGRVWEGREGCRGEEEGRIGVRLWARISF